MKAGNLSLTSLAPDAQEPTCVQQLLDHLCTACKANVDWVGLHEVKRGTAPLTEPLVTFLRCAGLPCLQKKRHLHPGDISQDPRLERVLGAILSGAPNFVAADVFEDLAKLRVLQVRSKGTSQKLACVSAVF